MIITNMPSDFYAPTGSGTDEAAWVVNSSTNAVELGWFQGYWPYPGPGYGQNFAYPQGYYTLNDGGTGSIATGQLPASHVYYFQISNANTGATVEIIDDTVGYNYYTSNLGYVVNYPRTNLSQGEVTVTTGAWMGGNNGTGTTSWGYYEPANSPSYYAWGSFSMCDNAPYWIQSKSSYSWKNGGY